MLARFFFSLLVIYTILSGATFDGILNAERRLQSVAILALVIGVWLWQRRRWRWYPTALDLPILLWVAAFALSLLANVEAWRRIAIGLWYMGLYILAWYALQDALANRALRRAWIVDALLVAGVPVMFVGFAQVQVALMAGLPLPRPVGTLGNPNTLGALLVVLIPLALGRLFMLRAPLLRVLLTVYALALFALLALSFSRGGWLGGGVALTVWIVLRFPLRQFWASLSRARRVVLSVVLIILFVAGAGVMIRTFSIGGRSLDVRTWIYDTAFQLIAEKPLTGSGLFTFGAGLSRLNSLPPLEPHSHAHNLILQVATELGVVGLVVLAFSAWRVFRELHLLRNRDPLSIMGIAAFAGIAAHHMVDVPAMMPALALTALLILALLTSPAETANMEHPIPSYRWQPLLLAAFSLALLASGIWSTFSYREYIGAMSDGIARDAYRDAATRVKNLAENDPALAVYAQQAGLLFGFAAEQGDTDAISAGIVEFRRYTELEPSYSSGWANLAALYSEAGETELAAETMQRAVSLAGESWSLNYHYGVYAEAAGQPETAQQAYETAFAYNNTLMFLPEWESSPVRQAVWRSGDALEAYPQTIRLLEQGDVEGARAAWVEGNYENADFSNVHIIYMWFALADGDTALAEARLQAARRAAIDANARAWVYLGEVYLSSSSFGQASSI
jgi:O-antigen ligase